MIADLEEEQAFGKQFRQHNNKRLLTLRQGIVLFSTSYPEVQAEQVQTKLMYHISKTKRTFHLKQLVGALFYSYLRKNSTVAIDSFIYKFDLSKRHFKRAFFKLHSTGVLPLQLPQQPEVETINFLRFQKIVSLLIDKIIPRTLAHLADDLRTNICLEVNKLAARLAAEWQQVGVQSWGQAETATVYIAMKRLRAGVSMAQFGKCCQELGLPMRRNSVHLIQKHLSTVSEADSPLKQPCHDCLVSLKR